MSRTAAKLSDVSTLRTGKLNSNAAVMGGAYPFFTCSKETFQIDKFAFDTEAVLLAGNNANGIFPLKHYKGQFNAYQRTYVIETKDPDVLSTRYLYFALRPALKHFESASIGAATQYLTKGILDNFVVHLPAIVEQERIASILAAYDDLIENNRRRITLLEEAAQLLYREWFVHFRFPGHEHVKIIDGVPEGWKIVSMEDVCTRITDGSHSSPKSVDEGYPMASVKDMHDWGIETKNCRYISHDDYEKLVRADCKPLLNDVLIAKDGSYLKHCFVVQDEIDLVVLSSIAILRPNKRISPHLLNFILRDPQTKEQMKGYVSGAALPRIILKEFRNFKIQLPNEETQLLWADHIHPIARQCVNLIKQNEQLAKARDLLLFRLMDGRLEI